MCNTHTRTHARTHTHTQTHTHAHTHTVTVTPSPYRYRYSDTPLYSYTGDHTCLPPSLTACHLCAAAQSLAATAACTSLEPRVPIASGSRSLNCSMSDGSPLSIVGASAPRSASSCIVWKTTPSYHSQAPASCRGSPHEELSNPRFGDFERVF